MAAAASGDLARLVRAFAAALPEPGDPMTTDESRAVAERALALLDLTDLSDTCTQTKVDALCRDARAGHVAAICVWPSFVAQGARALAASGIRIATVINFPEGGEDAARAADDAAEAFRDGAGEIDLVCPIAPFCAARRPWPASASRLCVRPVPMPCSR